MLPYLSLINTLPLLSIYLDVKKEKGSPPPPAASLPLINSNNNNNVKQKPVPPPAAIKDDVTSGKIQFIGQGKHHSAYTIVRITRHPYS